MQDLYIAEIYRPGADFLPLTVYTWIYLHSLLHIQYTTSLVKAL